MVYYSFIFIFFFFQSKDLANKAEKKLPSATASSSDIIARLEKLVFTDTYREDLNNRVLSDQHKNALAAKKRKGKAPSKIHDKATFVKNPVKNAKKEDTNSVPVTEIPRLKPEILPTTSSTVKNEAQNPVWFSESKTKLTASNSRDNLNGKSLILPTTAVHLVPTSTTRAQQVVSENGVPVQANGNVNRNRIPTQLSAFQRHRQWGWPGVENPVARSKVQNSVQSSIANQRQNVLAYNRGRYGNLFPSRNALQRTQVYQSANPRVAPSYARPPNAYQWPGNQALQGNRARFQSNWGRGYSPPSYSSDQLDIGRRKREVGESNRKEKRQNPLWFTSHQYPSRLNYVSNPGRMPGASYQQARLNYFQQRQNTYQNSPNPAVANAYQRGYPQRPSYGQSLGTGLLPARQQSQNIAAPGLRSQIKPVARYRTQPGILSGGHPVPVERWPTLGNQIQKPTSSFQSKNSVMSASPSSRSRIELKTNQNMNQNAQNIQTNRPAVTAQPTEKSTTRLPPLHEAPKPKDSTIHRTIGSKKVGPQNDLSKKLHDMTAPAPHVKEQVKAHKRQNSTVPQTGRNEKHVVPMFGGDILLSVGVLELLPKFARLSGSKLTEKDLKVKTLSCLGIILNRPHSF